MIKVLVIGVVGETRIDDGFRLEWIGWNSLQKIKNLSDYDTVIISLLSLASLPKPPDWALFEKHLTPRTMKHVLANEGRIVVLGDPRFDIPDRSSRGANGAHPFLDWTGLVFNWDARSGTTVREEYLLGHGTKFRAYRSYLESWPYALEDLAPSPQAKGELYGESAAEKDKLEAGWFPYIENRYGKSLAFEAAFFLKGSGRPGVYPSDSELLHRFGDLHFLPKTSLDEIESISLILRSLHGIELVAPEPDWAKTLSAPGQAPIDARIEALEKQFEEVRIAWESEQEQKRQIREVVRLLYAAEFELEPLVMSTLEALGARSFPLPESNKADAWITVHIDGVEHHAVIEIKSTEKSTFGESGLKQLSHWWQQGITKMHVRAKQIFIGNSETQLHPDKRTDPFGHGFRRSAELLEVCCITTVHLFNAYVMDQEGTLDCEQFWRSVFSTNGVFDLTASAKP